MWQKTIWKMPKKPFSCIRNLHCFQTVRWRMRTGETMRYKTSSQVWWTFSREWVSIHYDLSLMTSAVTHLPHLYSSLSQELSLIRQQLLCLKSYFRHCMKMQKQISATAIHQMSELRKKLHMRWGAEKRQRKNILQIRSIFLSGAICQTINPLTHLLKMFTLLCYLMTSHGFCI